MTSSGSVPFSFSPNIVRNMVKLMGPGASFIMASRYSSVGFLPNKKQVLSSELVCFFLLRFNSHHPHLSLSHVSHVMCFLWDAWRLCNAICLNVLSGITKRPSPSSWAQRCPVSAIVTCEKGIPSLPSRQRGSFMLPGTLCPVSGLQLPCRIGLLLNCCYGLVFLTPGLDSPHIYTYINTYNSSHAVWSPICKLLHKYCTV